MILFFFFSIPYRKNITIIPYIKQKDKFYTHFQSISRQDNNNNKKRKRRKSRTKYVFEKKKQDFTLQ